MKILFPAALVGILMIFGLKSIAQSVSTGKATFIEVPAGKEYLTSPSHQRKWGTNYRKEWATPVKLPVAMLDTLHGGMIPVKAGGGHQTKSLRLEDRNNKVYTLRTVNKTLGKVLPPDFLGTFIEDIVDDKVSMSYPYAAPAVAYLAGYANVYHTNPTFVYLPKQKALDTFPNFGDAVYLFEQKLDGNWEGAANLGNFSEFKGTTKVVDSLLEDNRNRADQKTFVRSRLFDMLINDWDRHEDQWEWGIKKQAGQTWYVPVPQDRDQAFFKYNGYILSTLIESSGMKYFQPFDVKIKDVNNFNFEQRNLDRFFANELTLNDWQTIARELQQKLTDRVIENSINQIPAEVRNISGAQIINNLKGRRDRLPEYATTYYQFLAREVDVPASKKDERFEVTRTNNATQVDIFAANSKKPFYSRTFVPTETSEIRLYGIDGRDVFNVTGSSNQIKLRLIGGEQADSMNIQGGKVAVYDDHNNIIHADGGNRLHLVNKKAIHAFNYTAYTYDKSGIKPSFFYNNDDYFYIGVGYSIVKHKWRKEPFAYKHTISANYSLSQKAFSLNYDGLKPHAFGNWDLVLAGKWDAIRWTNFFGLGNETQFVVKDINYYRARSEQWLGSVGLNRKYGHLKIGMNAFYQHIRVINDQDRVTGKELYPSNHDVTTARQFAGAEFLYNLHQLNDSVIPTKGYVFFGRAAYLQNLQKSINNVGDYQANLRVYVPLFSKFSMVILGGAQTITGKPEFYQYASIGGGQTFRGYRLGRFWGKTAVYNNNEIRFISNVKGHIYKGKLGLLAFYDDGRVWMPNQNSSTLHTSYGGGVILAPFNKIYGEVTYGISSEEKLIQLRLVVPVK